MKQRIGSQWQLGFLHAVAIVVLSAMAFPSRLCTPRRKRRRASSSIRRKTSFRFTPNSAFRRSSSFPRTRRSSTSPPATRNSGSSTARTTSATFIPAQAGIRSNLNLITASGHVYSFLLTEISNQPNVEPDLKIFVEPKEGSGIATNTGLRGYVSAGEAEAYKKELETLRSQTADQIHAAQAQSAEQVSRFRSSYATKLQFDYLLDPKAAREPFLVSVIYHDDSFTYIKCARAGKTRSL